MDVRLLIVDDYSAVRDALRCVFQAAGLTDLREAASCTEARRAVRQRDLDLVLLDLSLRDGDGLELLQDIKALNASLPVLIHTYHESPRLLSRGLRLGAAGYVVKGGDTRVLVAAVRRAAAGGDTWTADQMRQINESDAATDRINRHKLEAMRSM